MGEESKPVESTPLVASTTDGSGEQGNGRWQWVPAWTNSDAVFVIISMVSVVTMLCLIISQLMAFMVDDKVYILEWCLRLYMILFVSVFVLCEMEIGYFVEHLASMQNWIVRGIMYSFIGFIGESEAKSLLVLRPHVKISVDTKITSLFITVSSWAMVLVGVAYFIMGTCRFKLVRDRHRQPVSEATVDV